MKITPKGLEKLLGGAGKAGLKGAGKIGLGAVGGVGAALFSLMMILGQIFGEEPRRRIRAAQMGAMPSAELLQARMELSDRDRSRLMALVAQSPEMMSSLMQEPGAMARRDTFTVGGGPPAGEREALLAALMGGGPGGAGPGQMPLGR